MKEFLKALLYLNIGTKEHLVATPTTKREKAIASHQLKTQLANHEDDLYGSFPTAAAAEEFLHAKHYPGTCEVGYATNIFKRVVYAYTAPLDIQPPEVVYRASMAGAAKKSGRSIIKNGVPVSELLCSSGDMQIAAQAAKNLTDAKVQELNREIWGDDYHPMTLEILGFSTLDRKRRR
jgi:hypothetical protein